MNFFKLIKKSNKSAGGVEPPMTVEDVDAQMTTVASNVSQLPKYEVVLDSSTNPALWAYIQTTNDYVILVMEDRHVVIVGSERGLKDKRTLRQLRSNLDLHVYTVDDVIAVVTCPLPPYQSVGSPG